MMGSLNDSIIVSTTALLTFWDGRLFAGGKSLVWLGAQQLPWLPCLPWMTGSHTHHLSVCATSFLLMLSNVPWVPQLPLVENHCHRGARVNIFSATLGFRLVVKAQKPFHEGL